MAKSLKSGGTRGAAGGDAYLELVRGFPLRPIRSEMDLQRAISVINSLIDRDAIKGSNNPREELNSQ